MPWTVIGNIRGPTGSAGEAGDSAYDIAVGEGFVGTVEEWLASLVGDTGPEGPPGDASTVPGPDGASAYEVAVSEGFSGDEGAWLASLVGPAGADSDVPGPAGADGADGREVELQTNSTHIQWRYEGESEWANLVALSELKGDEGDPGSPGADGEEVSLQVTDTHIQWRLGSGDWSNLIALSELVGPAGSDGSNGSNGADGADGTPQWQGAWSAGTYAAGEAVSHGGSSYVANTATSQEPPHADWDVLAAKGDPGGGGGGASRSSGQYITEADDDLSVETGVVELAKSFALLSITASAGCWVRLYQSAAALAADAARPITEDPAPGSGVIIDAYLEDAGTLNLAPVVWGNSLEDTPSADIPIRVTNLSGGSASITIDFNILEVE